MNIFLSIFININLIKSLNNVSPNIAVFPFKTFHYPNKVNTEQFSSKDYMDSIHSSLIYLDIEIGKGIKKEKLSSEISNNILNNKQFLTLFFVINDYDFYINDNYFTVDDKKKICHYSTYLSTSYEIDQSNYNENHMNNAVMASDFFKIYKEKNIESDNYQLIKIYFRHSYDQNRNISFSCGNVGLLSPINQLQVETKSNFINQIHQNIDNLDYSFYIQYNQKNNLDEMEDGIIIIGEEALEKLNNPDLTPIYTKPRMYNSKLDWEFDINQIYVGDKILENEDSYFDILIKSNIDGIQIPYFFYQELNSIFFNKYYSTKICEYELVNNLYVIISCNADTFKDDDIQSFPEINFFKYKLDFNFTFTGKDLFSKRGNKYFFKMVIYFQKHLRAFYFGRLFLKKYKVIFNPESKAMYFFDINKKEKEKIIEKEIKKKSNLISFGYIFIGIVCLIIGIFFGRRYCIKRRRLYANELEDDNYIYETKDKNIKNEDKLLIEEF